jgi:hypothetical protein
MGVYPTEKTGYKCCWSKSDPPTGFLFQEMEWKKYFIWSDTGG